MKKAFAVIGSWFGDEGKGLLTDYLAHKHNAVVVRYNGGAQAGHTVVTPDGKRHVFHHFGSGTLAGSPTYLARDFIVNPFLFRREYEELKALGVTPQISASPLCRITTPWDMAINQGLERKRGDGSHGSVGVGIYETIRRHNLVSDKYRHLVMFGVDTGAIDRIRTQYFPSRCAALGLDLSDHPVNNPAMRDNYAEALDFFIDKFQFVSHEPLGKNLIVFEGAQGLLLDPEYGEMPHCTPSNCGMQNVSQLASQWGIDSVEAIYVSRTYLTRHGSGPLAGECDLRLSDTTNVDHEYQGKFRYAKLPDATFPDLCKIKTDFAKYARPSDTLKTAITHLDEYDDELWKSFIPSYRSYGPTRNDVVAG